jgi:hypothetical protein
VEIAMMSWSGIFCIASALLLPSGAARAEPPPTPGITAAFSPAGAVVGATPVTLDGQAGAGDFVVHTSTFPDGSVHEFTVKADEGGAYTDGPLPLQQLGTYYDVLRDQTTGASTEISYAGAGDFAAAVDPPQQTLRAGEQARFTLTVSSLAGFAGIVQPLAPNLSKVPGAVASWSAAAVKVSPGGSASVALTLRTLVGTLPGSYDLVFAGRNGAVSHRLEPVRLTVTGPAPNAITAALDPRAASGATTPVAHQGQGDFSVNLDAPSQTVTRGQEAQVVVRFESLEGFRGTIAPTTSDLSGIQGLAAAWSLSSVAVAPGEPGVAQLTVRSEAATPPGTYRIVVLGSNDSVTRMAPSALSLTLK